LIAVLNNRKALAEMARKKGSTIPVDWQKVEEMLTYWANGSDVADALGISEQTLYRAVQREKHTTLEELKRRYSGMVVLNRTVFLLNFRRYGKSQQTNPAPSQVRQSLQN
jgi:hypothetical protein